MSIVDRAVHFKHDEKTFAVRINDKVPEKAIEGIIHHKIINLFIILLFLHLFFIINLIFFIFVILKNL